MHRQKAIVVAGLLLLFLGSSAAMSIDRPSLKSRMIAAGKAMILKATETSALEICSGFLSEIGCKVVWAGVEAFVMENSPAGQIDRQELALRFAEDEQTHAKIMGELVARLEYIEKHGSPGGVICKVNDDCESKRCRPGPAMYPSGKRANSGGKRYEDETRFCLGLDSKLVCAVHGEPGYPKGQVLEYQGERVECYIAENGDPRWKDW